jgi:hypothetical protein
MLIQSLANDFLHNLTQVSRSQLQQDQAVMSCGAIAAVFCFLPYLSDEPPYCGGLPIRFASRKDLLAPFNKKLLSESLPITFKQFSLLHK